MRISFDVGVIPSRRASTVQITRMASAMNSLGHQVTLVTSYHRSNLFTTRAQIRSFYGLVNEIEIRRAPWLPNIPGRNILYPVLKSQLIRATVPDLVITRDVYVADQLTRKGQSVVFESHHPFHNLEEARRFDRIVVRPELLRVVVITQSLFDWFSEHQPKVIGKLIVAPDSADRFIPKQVIDLPRTGAGFHIGYIGHLYAGKGMEVVLELAKRTKTHDFHVVGGLEQDIQKWKARAEDCENLHFHGHQAPSEVDKFKSSMDMFLLPNQPEVVVAGGVDIGKFTSPLKMFEYMAVGKPFVASDIPVLKEILKHDHNCLLAKYDDIDSWLEQIDTLFENPILSMRIGSTAQTELNSMYTYEARSKRILELLELR